MTADPTGSAEDRTLRARPAHRIVWTFNEPCGILSGVAGPALSLGRTVGVW